MPQKIKIAFTSCMDAERSPVQPVWAAIEAAEPDALLLLGDQIYMDWGLSFGRKPSLRKAFEKNQQETMEVFASEMHARYAAQLAVPEFAKLVRELHTKGKTVDLIWDEHDFAWNNALGAGSSDKQVPEALQRISRALFAKFRESLQSGLESPFGAFVSSAALTDVPMPAMREVHLGAAKVLLLDTRSQRTERGDGDGRLFTDADWASIKTALTNAGGLVLMAGGSPLKHRGLLSQQGWWAAANADNQMQPFGGRSYPEYRQLATMDPSPAVLFLSGDIHRNAWGGPIEEGSSVVQVLSSGAALGHILFKKFPGSFASLVLEGAFNTKGFLSDGSVGVQLFNLQGNGTAAAQASYPLQVEQGKWKVPPPSGECADAKDLNNPADVYDQLLAWGAGASRELFVLCDRERGAEFSKPEVDRSFAIGDLDTSAFLDKRSPLGHDWPEAVKVSSSVGKPERPIRVMANYQPASQPTVVSGLVRESFERARAKGLSLVFFVHGFGKSFSTSVDQALRMRELVPRCEPLLYSWPTGAESGLLGTLAGHAQSIKYTKAGAGMLGGALQAFCADATIFQDVPAVVLARSMGCEALRQTLQTGANIQFNALKRVILSAAATRGRGHEKWLAPLAEQTQVVVTINLQDRTLKLAKWANGFGNDMLGANEPDKFADKAIYLSIPTEVGQQHDYLLRRLGEPLDSLNAALMAGDPIEPWLPKLRHAIGPAGFNP